MLPVGQAVDKGPSAALSASAAPCGVQSKYVSVGLQRPPCIWGLSQQPAIADSFSIERGRRFSPLFRRVAAGQPFETVRNAAQRAAGWQDPPVRSQNRQPLDGVGGIFLGLLFLTDSTKRRLSTIGLIGLGAIILGASILLIRNLRRSIDQVPVTSGKSRLGRLPRRHRSSPSHKPMAARLTKQTKPQRVIICTTNVPKGIFVVSSSGGEPFEVPIHKATWLRMTPEDWEEVFPGIAPPPELSQQLKLVFGGGRYTSYFGNYFETLNESSCPFETWAEVTAGEMGSTDIDEFENQFVVSHYDDLIDFLESHGVDYAASTTDDGGSSVMISVSQEWSQGMIDDDDPRRAINMVTYFFNANDELTTEQLYIWAPRLLDSVNEDLPDSSLILSQDDLQEYAIYASCTGSNNCSISGTPEGIVSGYWSQAINKLAEQYMNLEDLY